MKKILAGVMLVLILGAVVFLTLDRAKADAKPADPEITEAEMPTGFPAGEVQMPFLFHDGVLYYYNGRHMTDKPDPNWKSVGIVTAEDNIKLPQEEGTASHIAVGTQLFRKDGEDIVWFQWSEYYYGLVPYPFNDNPNG